MKHSLVALIVASSLLAGCVTAPARVEDKIDFTHYAAVNVAPVQFAADVAGAMPAEQRMSLEQDFRAALREGLPHPSVTEQASADAVRIEVNITELNASNPALNLLTTALLFVPFDAGGIAFEARFYDGNDLEPFAQTTYRHMSTPLELKGSFSRYGHATRSLRGWAQGLSSRPTDTPRKIASNH